MRTLFLVNHDLKESDGISLKIKNQFYALKEITSECYLSYVDFSSGDCGRFINSTKIQKFNGNMTVGFFQSIFSYNSLCNWIKNNKIEFVYIRYTQFCNPSFICFLNKIKEFGCAIYMEIPTYPYDNECKKWKLLNVKSYVVGILNLIERKSRTRLIDCVDKIITFSNDSEIFGIKAIKIDNAVSTELKPIKSREKESVKFVGVASLAFWHGYDRMIKSIAKYYNNRYISHRKVEFHIVGDSKLRPNLEALSKSLGVSEYVIFHGSLHGEKLDNIITECDIGIDSLGRHRSGNDSNNSLKSKEYLMRGMPLVKSHIDTTIDKTLYHHTVRGDDSIFNLEDIINWYDISAFNGCEIRSYAVNNFTWDKQFNKIISQYRSVN